MKGFIESRWRSFASSVLLVSLIELERYKAVQCGPPFFTCSAWSYMPTTCDLDDGRQQVSRTLYLGLLRFNPTSMHDSAREGWFEHGKCLLTFRARPISNIGFIILSLLHSILQSKVSLILPEQKRRLCQSGRVIWVVSMLKTQKKCLCNCFDLYRL
jgi:hypothetical protein